MTNLNELRSSLKDYAKDAKINLGNLVKVENEVLATNQVFGSALACAYATKNASLIAALEAEAIDKLSESKIKAAKTAAVLMSMNNIYYRFLHLSTDKEYSKLPAGLRMKGISDHGIANDDFEIYSLAISILNGCGMCIDAHAAQLEKAGLSKTQIQMVAKIAATINSIATALTIN